MGIKPRPLAERFWEKVDRSGDCWLWTGAKDWDGYGKIGRDRRVVSAHRVSWEMHVGPVPDGLWVLHNCPSGDNPSCVNPSHLFLGTPRSNTEDMQAKGRARQGHLQGEAHPHAKLTAETVRAIRAAYVPYRCTRAKVAAMFGLSSHTVSKVLDRTTWAHLD